MHINNEKSQAQHPLIQPKHTSFQLTVVKATILIDNRNRKSLKNSNLDHVLVSNKQIC
jgi:hypothetical protein